MNTRLPRLPAFTCALALALLASCGGGSKVKAETGPPPRSFPGFPDVTWKGVPDVDATVNAEASFVSDHAKLLGLDLSKKGIVPIRLLLGLRGGEQNSAQIRLDPDQMDMRLYLPDGTVLSPSSAERIAKVAGNRKDKVRRLAIDPGVLPNYDEAREAPGFVFFDLPFEDFRVNGQLITFEVAGTGKTVDVTKGLLAFNVMFEDRLQPFFVGVGN